MIICDTDFLIDVSFGRTDALQFIARRRMEKFLATVIGVGEMAAGYRTVSNTSICLAQAARWLSLISPR